MEPSREPRAVFLDIPKAFDKVWHEGLLFKIECNGIVSYCAVDSLLYSSLSLAFRQFK